MPGSRHAMAQILMVDFHIVHTVSPTNSITGGLERQGQKQDVSVLVDLPSSAGFLDFANILGCVETHSRTSEMENCLKHLMKAR